MADKVKGVEIDPVREKLIEAVGSFKFPIESCGCTIGEYIVPYSIQEPLVDHLIANLVVISNSETATKWIPVTERLPKERTEVLVVLRVHKFAGTDAMNVATALYAGCQGWVVADFLEAIEAETDGTDCEDCCHWITHWMPLPEPPKGE